MSLAGLIRTMSALAIAIFVTGMSAPSANAACQAPYCWGGIAINTATGRWGWSVNHATRGEAQAAATARCGYQCNRVLTFQNACGAYALANNGGWGWATRYDRYAAEAEALRQCQLYNPRRGCNLQVWACTSRRPN